MLIYQYTKPVQCQIIISLLVMSRKYQQIKQFSKIMKMKRQTGQIEEVNSQKNQPRPQRMEEEAGKHDEISQGEFQDQHGDQYQEEQIWESDGEQGSDQQQNSTNQISQQSTKKKNNNQQQKPQVFIGTKKNLKKGEVLDFDNNAYDMLHRLNIQWPSLSIDFVCQESPFNKNPIQYSAIKKYPLEVFTVQGSSNNTQSNSVYLTKWTKLHKTKYDDDPDVQGDSEDENVSNDQQPEVIVQQIETTYSINRIRSLLNSPIVSFWNDQGQIHIMDLTKNFEKLKNNIGTKKKDSAKEIVLHSEAQGFALSWNHHKVGQLITGNLLGKVQVFQNNEGYTNWSRNGIYSYHKGSVEDIVFSPNQPTVFASCSSDGTLQIIDMRVGDFNKSQIMIKAHDKDVNVCDWSRNSPHLIVTGSDDCSVKVWDLRKQIKKSKSQELLKFNWHTQPITSIRFQPNEQSVIAVASQDNSISIWDMSMQNQQEDPEIPNQLMFIHQGQEQIKEISFHPIYFELIVSSAIDGINLFKPSYEMPEQEQDGKQDLKKPPIRQQELDQYLQKMRNR